VEAGVQRGTWAGAAAAERGRAGHWGFDGGDPAGRGAVRVGRGRGGGELL